LLPLRVIGAEAALKQLYKDLLLRQDA